MTVSFSPVFPSLSALGLTARRLDTEDEAAVSRFCQQSDAFFTLVAGESPAVERARHLLESRPPVVAPSRKHVLGFERGDALVAIVDLLEEYPNEAEWYVGLLILSPDERGRGLGTALWSAVEAWIRARGGRLARLIVQEQNPDAPRFWGSVGFTADGRVEQHLATRTNSCWRFVKQL